MIMTTTRSRGFTLIELMVAMVVSAIVMLGIFAFSSIQQSTTGIHERNVRVQQALEGAMWSVGQDVRAAGMGWARHCTELRVWDQQGATMINPGSKAQPTDTIADAVTGERFWVLRDGIQGFWRSAGATDFPGPGAALTRSSANPGSAADAFDVIVAESNYTGSTGVFTMPASIATTDTSITVQTGTLLDNTDPGHLAEVRQLFPPGSFIILVGTPRDTSRDFRVEHQYQCPLLQVTGDVTADASDPQRWQIPIANTSGFNANLTELLVNDPRGDAGTPDDDWVPADVNRIGSSIVPLGRLRWSRYEIDYAIAELPYLVRYDIIGYIDGVDPGNAGAVAYPHCGAGACPMPQLHLPGNGTNEPRAVAIGPMIEDMQVAVGCDGFTNAGVAAVAPDIVINNPDATFEELGPAGGFFPLVPNTSIDENTPDSNDRDSDEWLGNAVMEMWAPDCVFYGTADYDNANWVALEGSTNPPPAFRMSPQAMRVTLVGSSEYDEQAGGLATDTIMAIEDRAAMVSPVGPRERFHLTEIFTPENLRWRDARIQ